MKKFFFGVIVVLILAVAGAWWFLPLYLQRHIESYLDQHVPMENRQVQVVTGNPFDVLQGRIERVTAEGDRVQTADLTYAHIKANLEQVRFDAQRLWYDRQFEVAEIGGGEVSASLAQEELQHRLQAEIDAIENLQVNITTEKIAVSGDLHLGNLSLGTIELDGVPLLKDNRLVVLPNGLRLNRWGVNGVNSALMKTIDVYDFRRFPIPVTAQKVELQNGMIVATAIPAKGNGN